MFYNQGKRFIFRKGVYTIGVWYLLDNPRRSLGLLEWKMLSLFADLGGGFNKCY